MAVFEPMGDLPMHTPCGGLDETNFVIQTFVAPKNHLSGISLRFGTYRRLNEHKVVVEVSVLPKSGTLVEPQCLIRETLEAAGLPDGDYVNVYFPAVPDSKERKFTVSIRSMDIEVGQGVTAWLSRAEDRIPGHVECATRDQVGSDFGLQARLITSNPDVRGDIPPGILYSPLSSCNMNCTHCISRHSRSRAVKMGGHIKESLREEIRSGRIQWMFTDYSGDILFADRKSPGELDFVLGLGIAVHIDTNGAFLDTSAIKRILSSPVDAVSISVDAAQDETYQAIRIGAPSIDQIFRSAKELVDARAQHGRQHSLRISMGYTLMRSNLHELPLFIAKAAAAGVDAIGCRHLETYHKDMECESLYGCQDQFNSIRAASIILAQSLGIDLHIGEELQPYHVPGGGPTCSIPWKSAVVLSNGDVMACCVPGSKMGNMNERSLSEIWTGDAYRRLRSRINTSQAPSLCQTCHFRRPLNNFATTDDFQAHFSAAPLLEELSLPTLTHAHAD